MSEKQINSERSKDVDKSTSKPPAGRKNNSTTAKSGSSNDENTRKKPTIVQPAPKHGRGRSGGGWDSAHQTRHDKHKDHQTTTKHQKTRSEGPTRSQTRHRQPQEIKRTSSGGKGSSRNHTHKPINERAKDSSSHPTENGGNAESVSTTSSSADIQDTAAQPSDLEVTITQQEGTQTDEGDDESNCELNQNQDSSETPATKKTVTDRICYDRDVLLELKDCTASLLTPPGLENCNIKEILKTSNRHSGEMWDFPHGEAELEEEGRMKHPTTLALRDHDPKHGARVSLTPQRRSFGSGCSWREGVAPGRHGTPSADNPIDEDQEEVFYNQSQPSTRKIDHIPYRSRKDSKGVGDWTDERWGKGGSWRTNDETFNDEDDEPEWMSYGPSDKNELMELKGLEEHELARQKDEPDPEEPDNADVAQPDQGKETADGLAESPPSSKEPELSSGGERDSGLPSSSPNDDEFMLDGFDFSTGLSICRELESDSDEEEVPKKAWPLPSVSNEQQLTSALINVLGVGREGMPGLKQAPPSNKIKAVTLDEIEETNVNDSDQSAFNSLLAALSPTHKSHQTQVPAGIGHSPSTTSIEAPVSTRSLYMNNLDELTASNPFHTDQRKSIPQVYRSRSTLGDDHDQKWPSWSSGHHPSSSSKPQLLTPSPMMLGMNPHVRHELPQQHQQPSGDWAREMERRRIIELQQMREKEKRLQLLQQQQQQHALLSKKANNNMAFMPTSVLRNMQKPVSQVDALMSRPQQTSGFEKDYSVHGGLEGGGHGDHHAHPYLPQQHMYMQYPRSNHMGRVEPHMGYNQPHPSLLQQQQIRMGIPTMKHPSYY